DVEAAVEIARKAKMQRAAADVGERGLRGFRHDFAELAGGGELALAVEDLNLGLQNAAADFRPGEAVHQAHFVLLMYGGVAEFFDAEKFGDVFSGDAFLVLGPVFYHAARNLAANVPDLALKVADSGLARVIPDD